MKRDTAAVIFRTVVFAGAMLGAPACTKSKPATTTPSNTTGKGDNGMAPTNGSGSGSGTATTTQPDQPDDGGNPCGGEPDPRPRGGGDVPTGRGFVLS